jgi:methionyl-tRNA formyltransferase
MEFIAILANTARSQAYLQTLLKENFKPTKVFILDDNNEKYLGKISKKIEISKDNNQSYVFKFSVIKPKEDLIATLSKTDIPYTTINTPDINSNDVYLAISRSDIKLVVISVYAGQILKSKILSLKKEYIHVHSGKLPQYRGSTTIYYSLLEKNKVAASAIIINEGIDTGDIICFKEFDFNFDPKLIDLIFDPLLRAVVLIYALKHLSKKYKNSILQNKSDGVDYFIIHPLLKHLAILKEENKCTSV